MQPDASPSSELFFGQPRIHHWKLPSQQESVNIILEKHQAKIKVLLGNEINTIEVFFDLKPQSQSWSILNDYIREKEFGFANGWIKPIE
jgi:hypothetical protein